MYRDRLKNIYHSMKDRCRNKNSYMYSYYGGRGITYEWETFEEFEIDMRESYEDHLSKYGRVNTTIDRIDNNGNYSKKNCRWATRREQSNNLRRNKYITFNGETKTRSEWAREVGISAPLIQLRIERGWPIKKALTKPPRNYVI